MKTFTYIVASAMVLPTPLAGSSVSQEINSDNITIVNQLTAWRDCSAENATKEWSLCFSPSNDGNGIFFEYGYCPSIEDFSPSNLVDVRNSPMTCISCPGVDLVFSDCVSAIQNISRSYNITGSNRDTGDSIRLCEQMCQSGIAGDECTKDAPCNPGYFCDMASKSNSGQCKTCPYNISTCFNPDFASSLSGQKECYNCQMACTDQFTGVGKSSVSINGTHLGSNLPISNAIQPSHMTAMGPLRDCSNLILSGASTCDGAKDHVCLVEDFTADVLLWDLSQKAEENGCVAVLFFPSGGITGQHSNDELRIPFVFVSDEAEKRLLKNSIGETVEVEVQVFGSACVPSWSDFGLGDPCTEELPCTSENEYCDYRKTAKDGKYIEGWCAKCPTTGKGEPDPAGCFFNRRAGSVVKGPQQVESCASSCDATNWFKNCKFCPQDITELDFGVENAQDQCHFCPNQDILYPDRLVPMFGDNVTCLNLQAFFERLEVLKESQNCKLAMKLNYICGCDGPGYAGANSEAKKATLAWLPRVSAILSFMGSSFIIYDTSKTAVKRSKIVNQLLITLSIFDLFGSVAYMFTTLPTPASDFLYGANGTAATCVTQGFFIQLGTIASYINASLAFYYLLKIEYDWSDARLKSKRVYMFAVPILIGLAFAFAGIPYYGNVMLWCNNTAKYWPESALIFSIFTATVLMSKLFCHVYQHERRTARYHGSFRMSQAVFKQASWFLAAFYLTWIPYLALQYLWASGKSFKSYGFILYASTSVPLQGFWNWIVYIRPRYVTQQRGRSTLQAIQNYLLLFKKHTGATISNTGRKLEAEGTPDHGASEKDDGDSAL